MNKVNALKLNRCNDQIEYDKDKIAVGIGKEKLLQIYQNMVRTREFDNKIQEMLKKGFDIIQHAGIGQEATPIAACANLTKEDYVMPYHRGWGWAIAKGIPTKVILAELIYKKTGCNRGIGGPQLASYEYRVMGRPGIQGAHIPIAAGIGLSLKYRNTGEVCVCFNGNGSSNAGNFYEALNLAATWKAPVVFIVENNLYEIFERIQDTTSVMDIATRGLGHGIDSFIIDGNDAILVYQVVSETVKNARCGMGPSLIEAKTYRLLGHGSNDTFYYGGYRSKEEVDAWKEKCPIKNMERDLLALKYITPEIIGEVQNAAVEEMNDAEKFAVDSPFPDYEEYFEDNYSA